LGGLVTDNRMEAAGNSHVTPSTTGARRERSILLSFRGARRPSRARGNPVRGFARTGAGWSSAAVGKPKRIRPGAAIISVSRRAVCSPRISRRPVGGAGSGARPWTSSDGDRGGGARESFGNNQVHGSRFAAPGENVFQRGLRAGHYNTRALSAEHGCRGAQSGLYGNGRRNVVRGRPQGSTGCGCARLGGGESAASPAPATQGAPDPQRRRRLFPGAGRWGTPELGFGRDRTSPGRPVSQRVAPGRGVAGATCYSGCACLRGETRAGGSTVIRYGYRARKKPGAADRATSKDELTVRGWRAFAHAARRLTSGSIDAWAEPAEPLVRGAWFTSVDFSRTLPIVRRFLGRRGGESESPCRARISGGIDIRLPMGRRRRRTGDDRTPNFFVFFLFFLAGFCCLCVYRRRMIRAPRADELCDEETGRFSRTSSRKISSTVARVPVSATATAIRVRWPGTAGQQPPSVRYRGFSRPPRVRH